MPPPEELVNNVQSGYPHLRLPYGGFPKPKRSKLRRLQFTFYAKISYAACPGLPPEITVQFTVHCAQ